MKKVLTVLVGFIHDVATGCWVASVLAVWWLDRYQGDPAVIAVLDGLMRQIFYAGLVSVLFVFMTGAGRTFTYVNNFYGADAETQRRKMLISKHIVLFVVFGCGIYWQYQMIFN